MSLTQIKSPQCLILRWSPPSPNEFSLSSDGCSKGNPGPCGGGFHLADCKGYVIWAST